MIVYEQPQEYIQPSFNEYSDPHKVVKWCRSAGEMSGGQKSKAIKLCEYDCLRYVGNNTFISLPLDTKEMVFFEGINHIKEPYPKDYNKESTPYIIKNNNGVFSCSCQWNTKMLKQCAHILALKIEFKRNKWSKNR